ncbi:MAG TPA: hypothetical protein VF950_02450 [Planctomycetota bacterium]
MGSSDLALRTFLSMPVPSADSSDWAHWKQAGSAFGPEAAPTLLEAVRSGSANEQYAAIVALRLIGYEAWADGFGRERTYRVRKIGAKKWQRIVPLRPPEGLTPG